MRIFWTDIRGASPSCALLPGRSPGAESAFAWSLLLYAARICWGWDSLPEVALNGVGKPVFAERPDCCFSLSHTEGRVLAALDRHPVGADIQAPRHMPERTVFKLTDERERRELEFFQTWVLRESAYKLTGRNYLRDTRFYMANGVPESPIPGAVFRLYDDIPGCRAAAGTLSGVLPERTERVPAELLMAP